MSTGRSGLPRSDSVMVDIETLSTDRHRAVVLSIAAVEFNIIDTLGGDYSAPWFGNAVKFYPCLRQQFARGRIADAGTQNFWRTASPEARADWDRREEHECATALTNLGKFIAGRDIWAHGICFDIGNLEGMCEEFGVILPWKYNLVFDERTITRRFPCLRYRESTWGAGRVLHVPESDNLEAVYDLWERWVAQPIAKCDQNDGQHGMPGV